MKFNDFYWHDAIIKNIIIDRNKPGRLDEINLEIKWPGENYTTAFVFEEVYWANLNLNFGIVADETILNAIELNNDDESLINFYLKWQGGMNEVKLCAFKIVLNSTGGEMKIIAKNFRVEKL